MLKKMNMSHQVRASRVLGTGPTLSPAPNLDFVTIRILGGWGQSGGSKEKMIVERKPTRIQIWIEKERPSKWYSSREASSEMIVSECDHGQTWWLSAEEGEVVMQLDDKGVESVWWCTRQNIVNSMYPLSPLVVAPESPWNGHIPVHVLGSVPGLRASSLEVR
jgi:hypothetical protein